MTQALISNLNTLQENLVSNETMFQSVGKQAEYLDKTEFNKILEDKKQVAETTNITNVNSQLFEKKSTITKDVADNSSNEVDKTPLVELKEVISIAMKESEIENSLDLTLAKEVTEIINQLKDFIESATEEGELIIDESMLENLSAFMSSVDFQKMYDQLKGSPDSEEVQELQALFAQIEKALSNKTFESLDFMNELKSIKTQLDSMFEATNHVEEIDLSTDVIIEKFSKIHEETSVEELEISLDEDLIKELNIESIESEVDSSNGESLMQNQTPQEQGLKAILSPDVESFDIKIDKTMNAQNVQTTQVKTLDANPSKILDQISKQLEGLQTNSKVNIVLNPESLGRVTVQLIKTGEGLSAQFTVASQEVRDMLMKGLDGLKESLTACGVSVDNVSVKLSDSQKSEYNADWTEREDSKGGNKEQGRSNKEEKEKGLFEEMMAQTLQDENGNV